MCSKGKGSVPRGRVYANYASRCATERITVLNPASFGKLVRVLFPGLKTRRLGVRGESKYHYVNFTLAEDEPDLRDSPRMQVPLLDSVNFSQTFSNDRCISIPMSKNHGFTKILTLDQQQQHPYCHAQQRCLCTKRFDKPHTAQPT